MTRSESKPCELMISITDEESTKSIPNLGIRFSARAESSAFASISFNASAESINSVPNLGTVIKL